MGVECQILLTRQLLTIKGSNMPKDVACCLCILRSSFCSWPKFVLTHCTNNFRSSPQAKTSKRCPRFRALVFSPKLDPSQIWKVLIFTNLLNLRSCRPNKNRGKKNRCQNLKHLYLCEFHIFMFHPDSHHMKRGCRHCLLHTATKTLRVFRR